jgi:quercetin dioxygenase-like cupin family protein
MGVVYGTRSTSAYTTLAARLRGNHGILCWNPLCRLICSSAVCLALTVPLLANSRDVVIDNSKVRVVRAVLEPGERIRDESPKLNRVVVWLDAGTAEELSPAGKPIHTSWKQYEAKWEPAGSSPTVKLAGKNQVRAIVVEFKGTAAAHTVPTSPQNPWIVDPKHYKIEFENEAVRVSRVRIGPKESTPLHEHSLDRVVVYLTALDFQIDPEGKQPEHSVLPAGSVAWGVPARHTEHNLSDQTFEAIVIEPKY